MVSLVVRGRREVLCEVMRVVSASPPGPFKDEWGAGYASALSDIRRALNGMFSSTVPDNGGGNDADK